MVSLFDRIVPNRIVLPLTLTICLAACGGSGSSEDDVSTTAATDAGAISEPTETTTTAPPDDSPDESEEPTPAGSSGGTAVLTIAGTTVQFDDFVCYYDDEAVEAFGDDDLTFAALGRNGSSTLAVSTIDSPFGPNYTVFYTPISDSSQAWQRVGDDAATIEDGRIVADGDFERIVDSQQTEEFDSGTLDANCG